MIVPGNCKLATLWLRHLIGLKMSCLLPYRKCSISRFYWSCACVLHMVLLASGPLPLPCRPCRKVERTKAASFLLVFQQCSSTNPAGAVSCYNLPTGLSLPASLVHRKVLSFCWSLSVSPTSIPDAAAEANKQKETEGFSAVIALQENDLKKGSGILGFNSP